MNRKKEKVIKKKDKNWWLEIAKDSSKYKKVSVNYGDYCDILLGDGKGLECFEFITDRETLKTRFVGYLSGVKVFCSLGVPKGSIHCELS